MKKIEFKRKYQPYPPSTKPLIVGNVTPEANKKYISRPMDPESKEEREYRTAYPEWFRHAEKAIGEVCVQAFLKRLEGMKLTIGSVKLVVNTNIDQPN